MSQQLQERFSDGTALSQDPDSSLLVDPTAINPSGLGPDGDAPLQDPTAVTTRVRRPQVKLTAEKLCSAKGLPAVMKHAPRRLRISKRRSSYDNLCHLLQFYQLWAHDLYPKAKFHDFVELCRNLGKTDPQLREYRIELLRQELEMGSALEEGAPAFPQERSPAPEPTPDAPGIADLRSEPPSPAPAPAGADSDDDLIYNITRRAPARVLHDSDIDEDSLMETQPPASSTAGDAPRSAESGPGPILNNNNNNNNNNKNNDDDDDDEDEDELAVMREMGL
ncbi:Csm3p [Lachancea thermotolerans CBS 6340]|uniref:Chromosome segregation in meiosis protein n=1 Tax=Lachancea thermotolerans (strain ATCC 56472 / CBS 6340 / NRRL Y-8284) TaxID=559295 RepID=C5DCL7_LACTC|nr:KLTH0B04092p [Lachancea thermotolerans CBS 6340]CAR21528.1 KLTH0B04092p [Lachancea thermotolerans CBS 6340]